MKKGAMLYEGKAKKIFSVVDGEKLDEKLIWVEFKDSLTAFNAQKKGSFVGKGSINRQIASLIFQLLKKRDIDSHWVADRGDTEMVCKRLTMVPLEVVVRNVMAGSLAKRLGLGEGETLSHPAVEFYYKNDELQDPFINDDHALLLKAVQDRSELETLRQTACQINRHLLEIFSKMGIQVVDFKLEFGRDFDGRLLLADEITPDSCRLWDIKTNEKLDKDRFRRDLGKIDESYAEVLNRLQKQWGKTL